MELQIIRRGPYRILPTPQLGWQGSVTGLYLHSGQLTWWRAPIPHRWHWCKPQSVGVTGTGYMRDVVLRCACGSALRATLRDFWEPGEELLWYAEEASWLKRNSRRKGIAGFETLM